MAMKDKITRKLIDFTVGRAIRDIRNNPVRGIRSLIEKGQELAGGTSQRKFLEMVQSLLEDHESPYFELTSRTVRQVEQSTLEGFGINIGYNACSLGVRTIREIEEKYKYNIPWVLGLSFSEDLDIDKLCSVISEGKKLGIHAFCLIHRSGDVCDIMPAITRNDDCAFALFISGEALSDTAVSRLSRCDNLMFAIQADTPAYIEACRRLKDLRALYSVYGHYGYDNIDTVLSDEWLKTVVGAEPLFALLTPREDADDYMREKVSKYVKERRTNPRFVTIPVDIPSDALYVDGVISEGDCSAMFDVSGQLYGYARRYAGAEFNITKNQLRDVLKTAFPK